MEPCLEPWMQPCYREYLLDLKKNKDEEERNTMLINWVKKIYESTHYYAERNSETYYKFALETYPKISIEFLKENMGTIIEKLQKLFPDSIIYHESKPNLGATLDDSIIIDWT